MHAEDGQTLTAPELKTERLLLRGWRESDREPFAALNADPQVTEYLRRALTREQSDALIDYMAAQFEEQGYGLWAVEVPGELELAGFVGLSVPNFETPFTPCVEVGWRLARAAWGHGYATEAARAALAFGFEEVGLDEVVSMTVPANVRSIAVMERLGMTRDPEEDFDHPKLEDGHPLQRHVLYRIDAATWEDSKA